MNIPKGLLIAGGLGAVGAGALLMLKGGDKPATDAETAPTPATGTGTGTSPAATAPAGTPSAPLGWTPAPAATAPSATTNASGTVQGQQVGPYTVVDDPSSGMQVVFETATQNPVGILDEQGTLIPITVDAQGNVSLAPEAGTAPTASAPTVTTPAVTTPAVTTPAVTTPAVGAPIEAATAGASQYSDLVSRLFQLAGVDSGTSAASDAITGSTTLAPQAAPMPSSVAPSSVATTPSATSAAPASVQVGPYTIIADPTSGTQVVFETATEQPVGVLDAQGNLVPLS